MKTYLKILYLLVGLWMSAFSGYNMWLLWPNFTTLMFLIQAIVFISGLVFLSVFPFDVLRANVFSNISLLLSAIYTGYYFTVLRVLEARGGWPINTTYIIIGTDLFLMALALIFLVVSVIIATRKKISGGNY